MPKKNFLAVAAFDIGRTRSAYGYSFVGDFRMLTQKWVQFGCTKETIPTSVLLNPNGKVHSFGCEAETKFTDLEKDGQHHGWRWFNGLHVNLRGDKNICRQSTVEDTTGTLYPALKIYTIVIKYLYEHFLEQNLFDRSGCHQDDILCILTVPAVWRKHGKTFMREAAQMAGIPVDATKLVFDSEAVAANCLSMGVRSPEAKCIVIDLQGEAADITVHQTDDTEMIEHAETLDGVYTRQDVLMFLENIIGKENVDEFRKESPTNYFEFLTDFENKMLSKYFYTQDYRNVMIPSFLTKLMKPKLAIDSSLIKAWFERPLQRIIEHVHSVLRQEKFQNVHTLLVKGKYTQSPFVQEYLKHEFSSVRVIFLDELSHLTETLKMLSLSVPPYKESSASKTVLIAALDIGTSYSGFAFSFKDNPSKIITNSTWYSGGMVSLKTATSLLLDQNGIFDSFGFEAEEKYEQLLDDEKHFGWRLFKQFKMILHDNTHLSRETMVSDLNGDTYRALDVFAMSIQFLQKTLMDGIQQSAPHIIETDIEYVITVPAIWDDASKQFMREAAIKAGIDGNRLRIALEPEVAAVWCIRTAIENTEQYKYTLNGSKYIVIDLGGGTADFTVQQVLPSGNINVIHKPSGGPWGGMCVNALFLEYLKNYVGVSTFETFKKEHIAEYLELIKSFEIGKRSNNFTSDTFSSKLPYSMIKIMETQRKQLGDSPEVPWKIKIEAPVVKGWFDKPIDSIIQHVKELLTYDQVQDVNTVFLVGGFSESCYVQRRLKDALSGIRVIVPNEPGLTVMKGTVLLGHFPTLIVSRVMANTYGISVFKRFDSKQHPKQKSVEVKGQLKVAKCFEIFVKANETVAVGHKIQHTTVAVGRTPVIRVYRTLKENPEYTTDKGCMLLGILRVPDDTEQSQKEQKIDVTFIFGETEIKVITKYSNSKTEEHLSIDCL